MGILDFFGKKSEDDFFDEIIESAYKEMKTSIDGMIYWSLKANQVRAYKEKVLTLTDDRRVQFLIRAIGFTEHKHRGVRAWPIPDSLKRPIIAEVLLEQLLKEKLVLSREDLLKITNALVSNTGLNATMRRPLAPLLTQIERMNLADGIDPAILPLLKTLKDNIQSENVRGQEKEKIKLLERIDSLLFMADKWDGAVKPTFFPGDDEPGNHINQSLKTIPREMQDGWYRLMKLAMKATGSKPSKKYLEEAKGICSSIGERQFIGHVTEWFRYMVQARDKARWIRGYEEIEFVDPLNTDMFKGLIWVCANYNDETLSGLIGDLSERCYRKIPGKGPSAPALGNACCFALAHNGNIEGIAHLSRLKLRIKQSSIQNIIARYLEEAAGAQGVTVHEIEDMAVEGFELVDGRREFEIGGYKAVLEVSGVGRTTVYWFKPDGSPQKSVPAAIRDNHAAELKEIKEIVRKLETALAVQRDRLDSLYKTNRQMSWARFEELYLSNGVLSWLSRKLIWRVGEDRKPIFFLGGRWVNIDKEEIMAVDPQDQVSLWHPAESTVAEVTAWREFMIGNLIVQPFKQAFREVYWLTDAEINTRTYSNRMAAHILKQHQFNSLAKGRNWKYSLLGAFDNYGKGPAKILIPEYKLTAEYWIDEIMTENGISDSGILLYVATDQVRFYREGSDDPLPLIDIPAVIFSEVMRDVDLFVGVASIGNDPAWSDSGGGASHRDYWQTYSFGDLTEVAKTRRQILERLLPRLKIASVAEIRDKFLVVKGKLRTYKIHLGSTNILMEPNDQYLCIVPDRKAEAMPANIFLPFEGDNALSVILSKALLLAADDKITDQTITSQIGRK